MGNQAARVCDIEPFARAMRERAADLDSLWNARITAITPEDIGRIADSYGGLSRT